MLIILVEITLNQKVVTSGLCILSFFFSLNTAGNTFNFQELKMMTLNNQVLIGLYQLEYEFFQLQQQKNYFFSFQIFRGIQTIIKVQNSYKFFKFKTFSIQLDKALSFQIITAKLNQYNNIFVYKSSTIQFDTDISVQLFPLTNDYLYDKVCSFHSYGASIVSLSSNLIGVSIQKMEGSCDLNKAILDILVFKDKRSIRMQRMQIFIPHKQIGESYYIFKYQNSLQKYLLKFIVLSQSKIRIFDYLLLGYLYSYSQLLVLCSTYQERFDTRIQVISFLQYSCQSGQFLTKQRTCLTSCPFNHYILIQNIKQKTKMICLPCNSNCLQCFSQENYCISCKPYYSLALGDCQICKTNHCVSCTQQNICLQCESQFTLKQNECLPCSNNCVTCPQRFFFNDGFCLQCHKNCQICLSESKCLTCKIGQIQNGLCKVKIEGSILNKFTAEFECQWPTVKINKQCKFLESFGNKQTIEQFKVNLKLYSRIVSTVLLFAILFTSSTLLQETINFFLLFQSIIQFTEYYKLSLLYSLLMLVLKSITSLQLIQYFQEQIARLLASLRPPQDSKFVDIVFSQKGKLLMVNSFSMGITIFLIILKFIINYFIQKSASKKAVNINNIFKRIRKYIKTIFFLFTVNYFKQLYFLTFNPINQINIFFGTFFFCLMFIFKIHRKTFNGKVIVVPLLSQINDIYLFFQFLGLTVFKGKKIFLIFNLISVVCTMAYTILNRKKIQSFFIQMTKLTALFCLQLDILIQFNSFIYVSLLLSFTLVIYLRGILKSVCLAVKIFKETFKCIINVFSRKEGKMRKLSSIMRLS